VAKADGNLFLGGNALSKEEILAKFATWLPASGLLEAYDAMLSYRWGVFDKRLVTLVADSLSRQTVGAEKRRVEVFLDDLRLQVGRQFQHDFMHALLVCKAAVPFVTMDALKKMYTLTAASPCDNVLLEWSVILELVAAKRLNVCLPILIGERKPAKNPASSDELANFDMRVAEKLPEVVGRENDKV
jgi:hypothetical protein